MPEITLLTEQQLRSCITLDNQLINIIGNAFASFAQSGVIMPPILSLSIEALNAEVDVKTAYIPGLNGFAIKVSAGFFDNPLIGLPSLNGLMMLLSAQTGVVQAVLLDNGYLTNLRTAAAGAVAARYLAPEEVYTVGVIGSGMQARLQIQALKQVRDFKQLLAWSRNQDSAQQYADEQSQALGIAVHAVTSVEQLVRESQLVVTTTPSHTPVILSEWLHPGLHITAMGSDAEHKKELHPQVLMNADLFVCDELDQSRKLGELRDVENSEALLAKTVQLGQICAEHKDGRTSDQQITICDLTGTGLQDTAIANYALDTANKLNLGSVIET